MVEENGRIELSIVKIIEYILRHSCNHWGQGSEQDTRYQFKDCLHIIFNCKEQDNKINVLGSFSEWEVWPSTRCYNLIILNVPPLLVLHSFCIFQGKTWNHVALCNFVIIYRGMWIITFSLCLIFTDHKGKGIVIFFQWYWTICGSFY